ncbi:MAG: SH3 domain-containing protein [Candidatus Omnitrophica bacterium]|nr:SH3 domain-containing protein [Candidatus Omnitrophota bacterium]
MRLSYPVGILYLTTAILASAFGLAYAEEKIPFLGEINAEKINLRVDATTAAAVIATLNKGERLEVVAEFYGWYKVRLPKNVPVYIKKPLAVCINYTEEATASGTPLKQCSSAKVLKDRVNIRAKPSVSSGIVGIANKNEVINVTADAGSWYKIEPLQNSFGWVHKKFVSKAVIVPEPEPKPAPLPPQGKAKLPEGQEGNLILTGMVKPYGVVFLRPATHKLIADDSKVYLLKGNRASLNALNHQKVKVTGKLLKSLKGEYPVVEVKVIEVVS